MQRPCGSMDPPAGERGVNVDPGHPETSPLLSWLRGDFNDTMPPDSPLPPSEILTIENWILRRRGCEP